MLGVVNLSAVAKQVSVFVGALRFFVLERNGLDVQRRQRVKFARLGDAVVIRILPQAQAVKDGVEAIDLAIVVAAAGWAVVFSQREEPVLFYSRRRLGLRRSVPK